MAAAMLRQKPFVSCPRLVASEPLHMQSQRFPRQHALTQVAATPGSACDLQGTRCMVFDMNAARSL